MKRYIYILTLLIITVIISSCKKEATLPKPATFASVIFNDPFGIFTPSDGPKRITYQGKPIERQPNSTVIKVLAGEGEFEFFNSGDTSVLKKKLNISKDTIKTYVFFKPDPNEKRVELLENNQLTEPRPGADHIKIRIANFAQSILGNKNVKVVFSQNAAPVDTIQTNGSEFTNGYTEMNCTFVIRRGRKIRDPYSLTFLDENNNVILDTNGSPVTIDFAPSIVNYDLNLYTIIVTVYNFPDQAPQIGAATLFED